jgi:hypothetical protein
VTRKKVILFVVVAAVIVLAVVGGLWAQRAQLVAKPAGPSAGSETADPGHEPPDRGGESVAASLPGMPEGYVLTAEQLAEKKEQADSGAVADIEVMQPGVHYVANEFIFLAGDKEEAAIIAGAYGGELVQYTGGLGVARLPQDAPYTLKDLIVASADVGNNLPPISVNLIYKANS